MSSNSDRAGTGRFHTIRTLPVGAALCWALAVVGCGNGHSQFERAHVAGFVSIDGVPLKSGEIRFIPTAKTKGPAAVAIVTDGAYELGTAEGPIIGSHRVEIESSAPDGDDDQVFAAKMARGEKPLDRAPIPPVYNRQSILTTEVSKDGNLQLDFPLNSSGATPGK